MMRKRSDAIETVAVFMSCSLSSGVARDNVESRHMSSEKSRCTREFECAAERCACALSAAFGAAAQPQRAAHADASMLRRDRPFSSPVAAATATPMTSHTSRHVDERPYFTLLRREHAADEIFSTCHHTILFECRTAVAVAQRWIFAEFRRLSAAPRRHAAFNRRTRTDALIAPLR